jgi:hypothetical protein
MIAMGTSFQSQRYSLLAVLALLYEAFSAVFNVRMTEIMINNLLLFVLLNNILLKEILITAKMQRLLRAWTAATLEGQEHADNR